MALAREIETGKMFITFCTHMCVYIYMSVSEKVKTSGDCDIKMTNA